MTKKQSYLFEELPIEAKMAIMQQEYTNKTTMEKTKGPLIGKPNREQQSQMYQVPRFSTSKLKVNKSVVGETIEQKMERIINNKEPLSGKDGAPLIYTERKEGVRPSTNIRTDRWEVALDATDKIAKSYKARREERAKAPDGGAESTAGGAEGGGETPKA